jgi:hypothetical protein
MLPARDIAVLEIVSLHIGDNFTPDSVDSASDLIVLASDNVARYGHASRISLGLHFYTFRFAQNERSRVQVRLLSCPPSPSLRWRA